MKRIKLPHQLFTKMRLHDLKMKIIYNELKEVLISALFQSLYNWIQNQTTLSTAQSNVQWDVPSGIEKKDFRCLLKTTKVIISVRNHRTSQTFGTSPIAPSCHSKNIFLRSHRSLYILTRQKDVHHVIYLSVKRAFQKLIRPIQHTSKWAADFKCKL